jgi:hypothetical protein
MLAIDEDVIDPRILQDVREEEDRHHIAADAPIFA